MGRPGCRVIVPPRGVTFGSVRCGEPLPCPVHGPEPERCRHIVRVSGGGRSACGAPLPCPVHGPNNAGGGAAAGRAGDGAPSGSPADGDLAGLAHDLCAAMEAGAGPERLRGVLVARGWRPPGATIDRDALTRLADEMEALRALLAGEETTDGTT